MARTLKYGGASTTGVTDPDALAAALARLAAGAPRDSERRDEQPLERVVDDAEASMERVDCAAAFLDAGGERRLGRAIRTADQRGDDALARQGRAVLETLAAYRSVVDGKSASSGRDLSETTSTALAQPSSGGES